MFTETQSSSTKTNYNLGEIARKAHGFAKPATTGKYRAHLSQGFKQAWQQAKTVAALDVIVASNVRSYYSKSIFSGNYAVEVISYDALTWEDNTRTVHYKELDYRSSNYEYYTIKAQVQEGKYYKICRKGTEHFYTVHNGKLVELTEDVMYKSLPVTNKHLLSVAPPILIKILRGSWNGKVYRDNTIYINGNKHFIKPDTAKILLLKNSKDELLQHILSTYTVANEQA